MKYVLRIKGVSECFGIRRAALAYSEYKNGEISLLNETHPISAFDKLIINDDKAILEDQEEQLIPGQEAWFSFNRNVTSSSGETIERIDLRVMLMPLAEEAIEYYKQGIEGNYYFDSWNGEFEYIISLIYDLEIGNKEQAHEWLELASKKRFKCGFIK